MVSQIQASFTVTQYFTKIKSFWVEFVSLCPAAPCNCSGIRPLMEFFQVEYVLTFLVGLNGSFSAIRGQILAMDPFPPMSKVISLVLQEEKQHEVVASNTQPPQVTFAAKPIGAHKFVDAKTKQRKDCPLCSHCGVSGHTQDWCFKLHGHPPGYDKPKGSLHLLFILSLCLKGTLSLLLALRILF